MSGSGPVDEPLAGWDPRRRAALERLRQRFTDAGDDTVSLADELIAERRLESRGRRRLDRQVIVLDASASLALIDNEPGADVVARAAAANDATISSINHAEVLQKTARLGVTAEDVDAEPDALSVTVGHFGRLDARLAASFFRDRSGLSLADRVCLDLARSLSSRPTPPIASGRTGPMTWA